MPSPAPDGVDLPRALAELEALCALSSPAEDPAGQRALAQALERACAARGLRVDLREAPGLVLLAQTPEPDPTPRLLLVGHLDTVLPARPVRRDGDRLLGSGALDMKAGLVTGLGALDLLRAQGRPLPPLRLVVVADEETSGEASAAIMAEHGPTARAVLVLEPGGRQDGAETVVLGRRGLLDWHAEVTGQSAHSGLDFFQGRSAAVAAADLALRLAARSGPGDAPTINVSRILAGDARFVDDPAADLELVGSSRRLNVVPDRARLDGEARYLRAADLDRLRSALPAIAAEVDARHGTRTGLRLGTALPAVSPDGPGAALADLAVAEAAASGWALAVERDRRGVSFPNLLPDPGAVPVLDGLGPVGEGMHTVDEWVSVDSLGRRIALLARLLERLGTVAGEP
jgi:glutamate carboxypeptidase